MSEPIRDADAALSREDERILRHLDGDGVALDPRGLLSLAIRGLVEKNGDGWRITPAGRRAVGAP